MQDTAEEAVPVAALADVRIDIARSVPWPCARWMLMFRRENRQQIVKAMYPRANKAWPKTRRSGSRPRTTKYALCVGGIYESLYRPPILAGH